MSHKIGTFTPGMANVPLPQTEQRRRTRELLGNPGGILTAQVLIGNVKVETKETKIPLENGQFPGLFPENPCADEGASPESISPADSHSGKVHQPAPAPVPIAHHTEVPEFSLEYRRWAEAFPPPVNEVEVQRVRDLLGISIPNSSSERPPAEAKTPEKQPLITQLDLNKAEDDLKKLGFQFCGDFLGTHYRLPINYSNEQYKDALPVLERYALCAKALDKQLKYENASDLLNAIRKLIGIS